MTGGMRPRRDGVPPAIGQEVTFDQPTIRHGRVLWPLPILSERRPGLLPAPQHRIRGSQFGYHESVRDIEIGHQLDESGQKGNRFDGASGIQSPRG